MQRRPDPALGGPELQDTFIMGLTPRSAVPLRRLGVRLPEGDWLGDLAPALGAVIHDVKGKVRDHSCSTREGGFDYDLSRQMCYNTMQVDF